MSEAIPEFKPNLERLKKLEQQASSIRIGGKVCAKFYCFFLIFSCAVELKVDTKRAFLDERRRLFTRPARQMIKSCNRR